MKNNSIFKVFLVEDNIMYQSALKQHLEQTIKDIQLHSFNNGEEMLGHIHKNPNLVILDYMLNTSDSENQNGMSILKEINFEKPYTPVIILSGQDKISLATQLLEEGAYDYVAKHENGFDRISKHVLHIKSQIEKNNNLKKDVFKTTFWTVSITAFIIFFFYEFSKYF